MWCVCGVYVCVFVCNYVCVLTGKAAASKLPTTSGNGSVAMVADSPAEDTGTNMKIRGKEGGGGGGSISLNNLKVPPSLCIGSGHNYSNIWYTMREHVSDG